MPYKIEYRRDCGNWFQVDEALDFAEACRKVSRALRRVKYSKEEDFRILLDGIVIT